VKGILDLGRIHYLARLCIFLITVALITEIVGCAPAQYNLAISSTEGGEVASPGEGTFACDEGEVVSLVAITTSGYQFIKWIGDVDDIADVRDATTTITMRGDYQITANFEAIPPLQYNLTISSTAGGCVVEPGEGTFTYDKGTVVHLAVAVEESPSRFVNWTGDVDTIADVSAATTTITMDDDYSITANFKEVTNWLRIGAVMVVAVLVVGLTSFFFIRRRKRAA
jgi:hypothetical protein